MAGESVEVAPNGTAVSASDLRSQILASIPKDEEVAAKPAAVESDEDTDAAEVAEPAEVEEVEAASDEDADDDTDDEDDEDVEEKSSDPETQKRFDAVRRAEKHARAKADAREAELTAREQKHTAQLAKLEKFETLAKRIKYDPVAVLLELGADEDDLAPIAQAAYAFSKEGAADPKRKEAVARLLREREKDDKYSAIEKRQAELEAKLEKQAQDVSDRAEADRFVADATTAAQTKFPLVALIMKADSETANAGMLAAYNRLSAAGKAVKPANVVAEYDRAERARLKRIGVDPDALAKTKPAVTTKNGKPVPAAKPAASGALTKEQILADLD